MKMRGLKPSNQVATFKQALEIIQNIEGLTSSLPVASKKKADDYIVYQNYLEVIKGFAKFEKQKAEITEIFRRRFF